MFAAEAVRLAALEVLCPTSALASDDGYPTLAQHHVFDSRLVGIDDLDADAKFTPCLALFTVASSVAPRAEAATFDDSVAECTLEIVAELAVASTDDEGEAFADAMPADDWDARLVLAALCAQVRRLLQYDERGYLFRRFARRITRWEQETFAIPQLGARWHRITIRLTVEVADDVFVDGAGMPKPLADLMTQLPSGSPAALRLAALSAHFAAVERNELAEVRADGIMDDVGLVATTEVTP